MKQKLLLKQKTKSISEYNVRRIELKTEIKNKRKLHYEEMFKLLNELYKVEIKIKKKYTLKQLAIDNDLSEIWVYRVMSWKYATPLLKNYVDKGNMSMAKACRLISRVPIFRQEELAVEVVKHKMTDNEMDRFATSKYAQCKQQMIEERKYNNKWNISRDILHYCLKMKRCLLAVGNVSDNQKEELINQLNTVKRSINIALNQLKK